MLRHPDHYVRHRAIQLAARLGEPSPQILDELIELLKQSGDGSLHYDAFRALVSLAPERYDSAAALLSVELQ
jgi:hypothetical protein